MGFTLFSGLYPHQPAPPRHANTREIAHGSPDFHERPAWLRRPRQTPRAPASAAIQAPAPSAPSTPSAPSAPSALASAPASTLASTLAKAPPASTRHRPALRVIEVREPLSRADAPPGRLFISGRLCDVCAELERLAALEARHR